MKIGFGSLLLVVMLVVIEVSGILGRDSSQPLTLTITNTRPAAPLPFSERFGFVVDDKENNGMWEVRNGVGVLRIPEGAAFDVIYQNALVPPAPTIIHAHGQTPPQGLDGVPFISSLPLPSGETIRTTFSLTQANRGSYWMHSHYGFQRTQGLFAALVVEGNSGYALEEELNGAQDEVIALEDYCLYNSDDELGDNHHNKMEEECLFPDVVFQGLKANYNTSEFPPLTCPGIIPATDSDVNWRFMLMNGRPLANPINITVEPSATFLRLRFLNVASTTNFLVSLPFDAQIVAADGHFVQPVSVAKSGTGALPNSFWIAVAQRIDILVDLQAVRGSLLSLSQPIYAYSESSKASQVAAIVLNFGDTQESFVPSNKTVAAGYMGFQTERALHAWEALYPAGAIPAPTRSFLLHLTGDNGFDSINQAGYQLPPMVPTYSPNPYPLGVFYGDRVAITFANRNNDPHPFHVHSTAFQIIDIDGQPVSNGSVRDTILIPGGCHNVTVMFDATAPGAWPIHCHNEFHQMAGMMTTLQYLF